MFTLSHTADLSPRQKTLYQRGYTDTEGDIQMHKKVILKVIYSPGKAHQLSFPPPQVRNMVSGWGWTDQFRHPGILDDLVDGWAARVHTGESVVVV